MASRKSWTENENNTRTIHLREHTLNEFREIFVNDSFFLEQMFLAST